MNKRVAIYLRLSNEDIDKVSESESIKNQRYLLLEEIRKRNNLVLVDEYCDEDLSGAGTYRPEFERLINDCEKGKIDIVLCKSQSRFSRDMEIIEKYLHNKFIEWNIRFISITDNADTNDLGNKKSRQINGLVNEWYLEDVSNNIRSAFKTKMLQGEFISPFSAYGYNISPINNNKLIIDPIASLTVKKIYNLYLKGMGYTKISQYLNNLNIPSPSLYKYQNGIKLNIVSNKPREKIKWSSSTIKTILTNELYIGNLIQGKRTTISYKNHKIKTKNKSEWIKKENTHEPIIDKNTFIKVQKLIKENSKSIKKTGLIHIFSGKIFCEECNNKFRKKNSKYHEYLTCSNYKICSNNKSIRYEKLEEIILNEINKKIQKYYNEETISKYFNKNKSIDKIKNLKNKIIIVKEKINKNKIYLKELYEYKVNSLLTITQYKELLKNYDDNEKKYNKELQILNKELKNIKKNQSYDSYKKIIKLNKTIIDEFIKKIYVGKINKNERTITIKWNF